ncbi:ribonucleoside-diphosphate reductase subunit alpha [bacterium]|nr:ribonucleoside-diphosphate reductase subunit alpha [bacterium]
MIVKKRDDREEDFDNEKIHDVLFWATDHIKGVTVSDIEIKVAPQFFDGITSGRIHEILINGSADMITEKTPNYQYVAANLLNFFLRKEVFGVSDNMPPLIDVIKTNIEAGVYDEVILDNYTAAEIKKIDSVIKHRRDYDFAYAGLQQLIDKYLLKDRTTSTIYETPQFMYMLICMTLLAHVKDKNKRLRQIKDLYNDLSTFKISLPTPIMCGVRTPSRQYSSCTLIDVGDNLPSIFHSNTAVGVYTANRAGIGLNFGEIRGVGSRIRNGEVVHTGIIPFLKMFEATTKSCTQNGVRGGSSTAHFPFWHKEIEEILVLKNNRGTEDNRVRKMDYSIQFCRLFYRRFVKDENITLFSPHEVPDLYDAFGRDNDLFEELYEKYERSRSIFKKQISARDMLNSFCQERVGTGRMYVMNVDHCNSHSSFKDKIRMSNLCQEITLPTTPLSHIDDGDDTDSEIALCVLSAINLGAIRKLDDLRDICMNIVRALDSVIEHQMYPVAASRKMLNRRSIGVGITNLAYYLAKHGVSYEDEEALELVDELMEHVQYYMIKASVEQAKIKQRCKWFDRTKYADGILPIDTYCKEVDKIVKRKLTLDWEGLREDVKKYGMRNSTLTALMPCESSSLVTNSTNGVEPPRGLLSIKKSKQGLIPQVVPDVFKLQNKYTLAFDMENNRGITNIIAVIQKYTDQAISANHYYKFSNYQDQNLPISEIANDILYSYKMGLKTLYYANTDDGKTDASVEESSCASGACSI